MNRVVSIIALLWISLSCAQEKKTNPAYFIPKGYTEFEKYFGDLNKDGLQDCVLIIKKIDSKQIVLNKFNEKVDRNRRGIIILFKTKQGYKLAEKNYNCFTSENEDGGVYYPPELFVNIKNNKLYIIYAHGRYGHWSYTFRYQNSSFKLIGYDYSDYQGPRIENVTSINFLTQKKQKKANINLYDEGGEEKFIETWSTIKIDSLIKLSEIKDFYKLDIYDY